MATMKCSKCKSTNIQVMGNNRKGFSVGKALGGALLTGGIGTLAGFAGKICRNYNTPVQKSCIHLKRILTT